MSQKSSSRTSSTADAEIFALHGLLLAQKPLTKTRTPGPKKYPRSPVLRLTLTFSAQINYSRQTNPWWKLSPFCPKNHPRNPVLPLTLKSSMYIDYCWLRNRWRKLGPSDQKKSSKKPSSTADADIFCANKLLLTDKLLMKTEPLCPKNHPRKPVLRLTLKSSLYIDYC